MPVNVSTLNTIKELAQKASQGKWRVSTSNEIFTELDGAYPALGHMIRDTDADYVGAICPEVILELIRDYESAKNNLIKRSKNSDSDLIKRVNNLENQLKSHLESHQSNTSNSSLIYDQSKFNNYNKYFHNIFYCSSLEEIRNHDNLIFVRSVTRIKLLHPIDTSPIGLQIPLKMIRQYLTDSVLTEMRFKQTYTFPFPYSYIPKIELSNMSIWDFVARCDELNLNPYTYGFING